MNTLSNRSVMPLFLKLATLMIFTSQALAYQLAVFDDPQRRIDINYAIEYTLSDKPELFGDEVWQKDRYDASEISEEQFLHFRTSIKNATDSDQQIWLTFEFPSIEKLTVSDGINTWITGDAFAFNTRPIYATNYHFPLQIRSTESLKVSGHMQGKFLRYNFELATPALINQSYRETLQLDMLFFGAMTVLIIVALLMFTITRKWVFLSFASFAFAVQAWLFRVFGYGFELLWPNSPWLNDITYLLSVYAIMLSAAWMLIAALSSDRMLVKRGSLLIAYTAILPILGLIFYLLGNLKLTLDLPLIWFFPFNFLLVIVVILELKSGSKRAKWFSISMLPIILSGLIVVGFALGIDLGIEPKAALLKGLVVTCFLLIFSTGTYLIRVLQNDRDRQKQLSELSIKESQKLEALVKERTAELEASNQQLKDLAHIDSLTQLPNRRSIDLFVDKLDADCVPVNIAMIDLDHFKKINDSYGHDVGDVVLQEIAKLVDSLRSGSILAGRYGGEEFAVVSRNTEKGDFEQALKELHALINTTTIVAYPSIKLGACIGWVSCPKVEEVIEAFKQADQALYQAKLKGRNKVIEYSLPD